MDPHDSSSASASAGAFLLPLILGLCSIGFIFSAVIAVSPTAAEIFEEGELMRRIGQSQAAQSQAAQSQATRYEPQVWQPRRSGQAQPGQAQPRRDEPGSLFRPHRPKIQP